MKHALGLVLLGILVSTAPLDAAEKVVVETLVNQPDDWFKSEAGARVVDNIVSWQNPWGGWLKQYDASITRPAKLPEYVPAKGIPVNDSDAWNQVSTFDNSATFSELRILARAVRITGEPRYRQAFDLGLKFVFDAQYPNGGWPQRFPIGKNYGRHITFNDNAMVGVMRLLHDVSVGDGDFAFVDPAQRKRAGEAFDRGVECILKCQVVVDGRPTVWCQQHDAETLAPASARAYELPSLCTFESASITELLMQLPNPSPRVVTAVDSAVAWFQAHQITGKKYEKVVDPALEYGVDRRLVDDPSAKPLWARFYDIESNKPFFCDRDGVKRWSLEEVGAERRARYAWYNTSPQRVIDAYGKWKAAGEKR